MPRQKAPGITPTSIYLNPRRVDLLDQLRLVYAKRTGAFVLSRSEVVAIMTDEAADREGLTARAVETGAIEMEQDAKEIEADSKASRRAIQKPAKPKKR